MTHADLMDQLSSNMQKAIDEAEEREAKGEELKVPKGFGTIAFSPEQTTRIKSRIKQWQQLRELQQQQQQQKQNP
jgi:hypothetical protein